MSADYTLDDLDADIVRLSHMIDVTYDRWMDNDPNQNGSDFHMGTLLLVARNMAHDLIRKTDRTEGQS
jgi:hypothetical protein